MPYITTPAGLRLHYHTWGTPTGEPVLLIHGLQGRATLWTDVAKTLAAAGFWAIACDLPGHGDSDRATDYSPEAAAASTASLLDQLHLAPAHVVGHSLGGAIAWTLAARHPQHVRRLVIEDQHPHANLDAGAANQAWAQDWTWHFATRAEGLAFLQARGRSLPWWEPSLIRQPDGTWGWAFHGPAVVETARRLYERDRWTDLQQVQAPTLLIRGADSPHLAPDTAARMAITLPRGHLLTLPGNHWVHRNPEPYTSAVAAFLRART